MEVASNKSSGEGCQHVSPMIICPLDLSEVKFGHQTPCNESLVSWLNNRHRWINRPASDTTRNCYRDIQSNPDCQSIGWRITSAIPLRYCYDRTREEKGHECFYEHNLAEVAADLATGCRAKICNERVCLRL